ncbi:YadA-like family protein [Novosphingobium soli]|uniref:YadA-like family protein n=1 Tax=Novosphingobium soli TaxID=574956 RepID=A0ABV6CUL2_9SPHN
MKIFRGRASRLALSCAFLTTMAAAEATTATAQSLNGETIPLNDFCRVQVNSNCTTPVIGTRVVTSNAPSVITPFPGGGIEIRSNANIAFDGQLQVDGLEITGFGISPSLLFDEIGDNLEILASANYDSEVHYVVNNGQYTYFTDTNFSFNSFNVSQIGISIDDGEWDSFGSDEGYFTLRSVDPTAVVNNSTAVAGTFSQSLPGSLQFGTLTGTATVVANPGISSVDGVLEYISPFGLEMDVAQTVTTQLDETGLTTPMIAVTAGIEMNGSKVTGLAAGTLASDAVNKAQLDTEAQARIAADLAHTRDIAAEAAARTQADNTLNQRIANEEAARKQVAADLQSESNARAAADLALGTQLNTLGARVDTLTTRVENIERKVDRLGRKIASSTAVAVAMSGNTFLPNTSFNLTANLATFDGAQAGAFQMGAMVSDNVAVNAGVATGFNKGGKTAGRVGFTVGW